MKRNDPYVYTRGQWKHNELVWAVLAVLDVTGWLDYPPLTASAIQSMTGCNYKRLISSLPKWTAFGWIKRYEPRRCKIFVKPMYTYSITKKGKCRMFQMEYPQQRGPLTFKPGVNRDAVLSRLPFFRESTDNRHAFRIYCLIVGLHVS